MSNKKRKDMTPEEREKFNAYYRKYYKEHSAAQKARAMKWKKENPEKTKAYRDKASTKAYHKQWEKENPERVKTYWQKSNDKVRAARALRKLTQSSELRMSIDFSPLCFAARICEDKVRGTVISLMPYSHFISFATVALKFSKTS